MITITLGDGTVLTGFHGEEYEFWRTDPLDKNMFTGSRMHNVVIYSDDPDDTNPVIGKHELLVFAGVTHNAYEGRWYLALREPEITRQDIMEANIAYLAMMTGVDL